MSNDQDRDAPAPGGAEFGSAVPADNAVPAGGGVSDGATGPDLARAVLDAVRTHRDSARRSTTGRGRDGTAGQASDGGSEPPCSGQGRASGPRPVRSRGYSGPGPDPRDPQPFGAILARLVKARGWQRPAAEATIFGSWSKVIGPEIADHCRPVRLEAGELTIEAESTAWATQLRLLSRKLLARIAGEVGHNVVTRIKIHGPVAPSWSRGARRVRGPGPRDTYG